MRPSCLTSIEGSVQAFDHGPQILQRHQHVLSSQNGPANPGFPQASDRHRDNNSNSLTSSIPPPPLPRAPRRGWLSISFLPCQRASNTLHCTPLSSKNPWRKCILGSWALTGMRRVQYVGLTSVVLHLDANGSSTPSTIRISLPSRPRRWRANNGRAIHGHRSRTSPWPPTSRCNNRILRCSSR